MLVQREKQIICGNDYKEVDIIKAFTNKKMRGRGKRKEATAPKQKKLNDKNSRRYFLQLINSNFEDFKDWLLHLTYDNEHFPHSVEEAERTVRNFIRRLNYLCKKKGVPNCKYICVTSDTSTKTGKLVRVHHHIILSCELSRAEILSLWNYGRKNLNEIQGEGDKFSKLCEYLRKNTRGGRRWTSSINLKKPMQTVPNDFKYSAREIEKIAKAPLDKAYWERKYKGWELIQADDAYEATYNEITGWSIYLKLRRKKDKIKTPDFIRDKRKEPTKTPPNEKSNVLS